MEPEGSLQCSQKRKPGPYSEPDGTNPFLTQYCFVIRWNIILPHTTSIPDPAFMFSD
jgi:hypothetical protein